MYKFVKHTFEVLLALLLAYFLFSFFSSISPKILTIPKQIYAYNSELENIRVLEFKRMMEINKLEGIIYRYNKTIPPKQRTKLALIIYNESKNMNFDPILVSSVIKNESTFNSKALSSTGARGLMQLLPSTAKYMTGMLNIPYDKELLWDEAYNIHIGITYLLYLKKRNKSMDNALKCYYAGSVTDIADGYRDKINKTYAKHK